VWSSATRQASLDAVPASESHGPVWLRRVEAINETARRVAGRTSGSKPGTDQRWHSDLSRHRAGCQSGRRCFSVRCHASRFLRRFHPRNRAMSHALKQLAEKYGVSAEALAALPDAPRMSDNSTLSGMTRARQPRRLVAWNGGKSAAPPDAPNTGGNHAGVSDPRGDSSGRRDVRARLPAQPRHNPERLIRRRRWAASGFLPPQIAIRFTLSEQAVLAVLAWWRWKGNDECRLSIGAVASMAGVCRTTTQNAVRTARGFGLLTVQERRHGGRKSETNVIRIISKEWLTWLSRRARSARDRVSYGQTTQSTAHTRAMAATESGGSKNEKASNTRYIEGKGYRDERR